MSNLNKLNITLYLFLTIAVVNTAPTTTAINTTTNKLPTSATTQKRTTPTTTTKPTTTTVSTTHSTTSTFKPEGPQHYEYFMDTCSSQNKQFLYNIDDDVIVRPWLYGPNDPHQKLPPVRCSFTIARYSATGLQFSFDKIDIEDCGVFIIIYYGSQQYTAEVGCLLRHLNIQQKNWKWTENCFAWGVKGANDFECKIFSIYKMKIISTTAWKFYHLW